MLLHQRKKKEREPRLFKPPVISNTGNFICTVCLDYMATGYGKRSWIVLLSLERSVLQPFTYCERGLRQKMSNISKSRTKYQTVQVPYDCRTTSADIILHQACWLLTNTVSEDPQRGATQGHLSKQMLRESQSTPPHLHPKCSWSDKTYLVSEV